MVKLILKAILLYFTTFLTIFFISAIDSIAENSPEKLLICIIIISILIFLCIVNIDKNELNKLTFNIVNNEKD